MVEGKRVRFTAIMENWYLRIKQNGSVGLAGNATGHPRFREEKGINTSSIIGVTDMGDYKIAHTINTDYSITADNIIWWYSYLHATAYDDLTAEQLANNDLKIKVKKAEEAHERGGAKLMAKIDRGLKN